MKKGIIVSLVLLFIVSTANAQFWKSVKKAAEETVENVIEENVTTELTEEEVARAVVGIGYPPQGRIPNRTAVSFHLEACANAIMDAGLVRKDIDGLMCYRQFPQTRVKKR